MRKNWCCLQCLPMSYLSTCKVSICFPSHGMWALQYQYCCFTVNSLITETILIMTSWDEANAWNYFVALVITYILAGDYNQYQKELWACSPIPPIDPVQEENSVFFKLNFLKSSQPQLWHTQVQQDTYIWLWIWFSQI